MARTGSVPTRSPRRGLSTALRRRERVGLLYLTPFAVVFVTFLLLPLAWAFWMSLHTKTLASGEQFAGLENYARVLADERFLEGLLRVGRFAVIFVPIQIGAALAFALLLDEMSSRLARFTRLAIFVPYAVPAVIGALMWGFLYSPGFGPLNEMFGWIGATAPDLLSPGNVFYGLTNIVTWQWTGYYMVIMFSALQSIDPSIYEAARLDGASRVQTALRIKAPMIGSAIVLTVVFSLIGTLQFFTEPQVLQSVAAKSIDAAYTPNLYAYNLAFSYNQFNYASTISFALGVIVFIGAYAFLFLARKRSGLR